MKLFEILEKIPEHVVIYEKNDVIRAALEFCGLNTDLESLHNIEGLDSIKITKKVIKNFSFEYSQSSAFIVYYLDGNAFLSLTTHRYYKGFKAINLEDLRLFIFSKIKITVDKFLIQDVNDLDLNDDFVLFNESEQIFELNYEIVSRAVVYDDSFFKIKQ